MSFIEVNASLGVEIFSPLGFLIILIGIIFTIGMPVLMILKGRKD